MKTSYKFFSLYILTAIFVGVFSLFVSAYPSVFAAGISDIQATESVIKDARVEAANAGLTGRVAPGELLPISVKLLNFGGGKRVDVLIQYEIFSVTGEKVYGSDETVAVETTANFVKMIQIPFGTVSGTYVVKASVVYEGQLVPATTNFPFTVERKFFGFFQSDFFFYGGAALFLSILMFFFGHEWIKHRRGARFTLSDYSDIPNDKRIFYEILSDTIMQMRTRVGDEALTIAANIDGLKIDIASGRVLALTSHPSKIIATLVSEYEKLLGKKVSFSFRREKNSEKIVL